MDRAVRDGDHQHPQRHRANMLMGFPYGKNFVYDEMLVTGPAKRASRARRLFAASKAERTGAGGRSRARVPRRKNASPASTISFSLGWRQTDARFASPSRRPRSRLWIDLENHLRIRAMPAV